MDLDANLSSGVCMRSLISAFVFRFFESILSRLATSKISISIF